MRSCGPCTLCCTIVPVAQLGKPAWQRCHFAEPGRGCRIYAMRPSSCRTWSCSWLRQVEFPADLRPDLAHVVFDPVPDVIYQVVASGERQGMECVQLWVDPLYPEAHRAPAVRDIIAGIAVNHHMPTLARIGPGRGLVILAPCLTSTAEWHEQESLFDAAAGGDPVARVNALRAAGEA